MLTIFYGAAGVGKNYIGKLYADKYDCYYYDADLDLTDKMKVCIKQKKSFTQDIRDEFFDIVASKISHYLNLHQRVVVTQAFSQEVNRHQINTKFPHAKFCCITTSPEIQLLNIRERNNEINEEYLVVLNQVQQPATQGDFVLNNNRDDEEAFEQFIKLNNHTKIIK